MGSDPVDRFLDSLADPFERGFRLLQIEILDGLLWQTNPAFTFLG